MNSVHDMGGMQGFGPIHPIRTEPVFHAPWEGRVMAMRRALGAIGKIRGNGLRPELESIPPAEYLGNSYYQNWLHALVEQLVHAGVVTREELERPPANGPAPSGAALQPSDAAALPFLLPPVMLKVNVTRRFHVGGRVRARNIHPVEHTRLPRYVRGRAGDITELRGVQALPETNVYGAGAHAQAVYCVRFAARELWGDQASPRDSVYLDLWEAYLEPA